MTIYDKGLEKNVDKRSIETLKETSTKKNKINFRGMLCITYIIYLCDFLLPGSGFIGIFFSYYLRSYKDISIIEKSHLSFAIRFFWLGVLFSIIIVITPFSYTYISGDYVGGNIMFIYSLFLFIPLCVWFLIMIIYALILLFLNKKITFIARYHSIGLIICIILFGVGSFYVGN